MPQMFNKTRLKDFLVKYKEYFAQTQWIAEKYKWEAVQYFQLNWDINSADFADMLTKSSNLLERYENGSGQHYQYENAISTYLWLPYLLRIFASN